MAVYGMHTINVYSNAGMERELSSETWDCLFDSDSIFNAFQDHPDMCHMNIRRCDNIDLGWCHGFDFDDVLTETEDNPLDFNEKSHGSNSNLELHLNSELALTLDPNLILPRMDMPIRSPVSNDEAAMLETASMDAGHEEEEAENESEAERADEESAEEEEEIENEEMNRTEYESEEEETDDEEEEEEEDEEEEETEDDEQDGIVQRSLTPSSVEAPTSMSSSSAGIARTLTAASSPTIQLARMQMQHSKMSTVSSTMKVHDIKVLAASPISQPSQHIRKQIYNNNLHDVSPGATTVMIQTKREKELVGHRDNSYPKPAYSYSCLIAMALKNSRTGSLPVSEIYNFMCRHFPYFKTAPNGWKNSVRHNLSLNKCFEKIEKPPGNGSQRKGCLWAIHPTKIAKMDEEVRKWSRKDPMAIKRAMVHPDHLELLERGEMKYEEDDRYDEMYEDAESYAESETAGSMEDDPLNDEETVTYDDIKNENVEDDIVVEQLYDIDLVDAELIDSRLSDFPKQEEPVVVVCPKRPKTLSASQTNYVYQQVDASSRRKAHLVALRSGTAPGTGSFLESD